MKKLLLVLVLAMTMLFSAACGGGEGGNGGSAGGAGEVAGLTAYQQLNNAYAAYEDATSMSMEFVMNMEMSLDGETFMNYVMSGDIDMNMDDETDVQLSMVTKNDIDIMGESVLMDLTAYYRDGYYYLSMEGMNFKALMPIEEAMEQAAMMELGFEESAVKSQEIDGDTLTFVLDGNVMSYIFEESMGDMMAQFGSDASISYSDVTCVATLNGEDLDKMVMDMEIEMNVMGETALANFTITMDVKQIGNVTVNFPADLDDYIEVDYNDLIGY